MTPTLTAAPNGFAVPSVDQGRAHLPEALRLPPSGQPVYVEISEKALKAALKQREDTQQNSRGRIAALGYVLAHLPGITDEEAATIIGVKLPQLRRYMHGEMNVPDSKMDRLIQLTTLLNTLHLVLEPEATARWLRSEIPALGGRTPLQALGRGRIRDLLDVVSAYTDPSFG